MANFTAVLVKEDEVVERRGRAAGSGKPTLADEFAVLIEKIRLPELVMVGKHSRYYDAQGYSENVIRSAAKYHGYSVHFAKTEDGTPVFRFEGRYVEMDPKIKAERRAKYLATRAANAAAKNGTK